MESVNQSLLETGLTFYFVGDYNALITSKDLTICYEKIVEHLNSAENVKWISEQDCIKLSSSNLSKKQVFLFQEFSGEAFDSIQNTKALVLGPRCVLSCLLNDTNIPNLMCPIFTVAMQNLIVCASGMTIHEKDKLGKLIGYMGGYYVKDRLNNGTTHLVTNTVMSQKYEKAATNNINIMKPDWIHKVWADSNIENAIATDKKYDRFKVPPFYSLRITTTGLNTKKKNELKQLIENNGGIFEGTFRSEDTDILILEKNNINSNKYKAAVKSKKECLVPDWIIHSVTKGYALPTNNYKVNTNDEKSSKLTVSTPTKGHTKLSESVFNADCTNISEIAPNFTINETISNECGASAHSSVHPSNLLLPEINVKKAKMAGPFLDGCNIFVCGFNSEDKETLCKILNSGSATRFNDYNSNVSHILVGKPNKGELKILNAIPQCCPIVTLDWLFACISLKHPAPETNYLFDLQLNNLNEDEKQAHPSPASKKNIQSMNVSFRRKLLPKKLQLDETISNININEENQLVAQYSENQVMTTKSGETERLSEFSSYETSTETQNLNFFQGLSVYIHGFIEESFKLVVRQSEYAGAILVASSYTGIVDYLVVPIDIITLDDLTLKRKHVVNEMWFEEAVDLNELIDIKYYHRPILIEGDIPRPFENINIVLSLYTTYERNFITELAKILGATIEEKYVKNKCPILLCPLPEGAKYHGALNWGLPVVTSQWLLACLAAKKKVPMKPYLVGKSIVPNEENDEIIIDNNINHIVICPSDFSPVAQSTEICKQKEDSEEMTQINLNDMENTERRFDEDIIGKRHTFAKPETPVLKHRRLSEIGHSTKRGSPQCSQSPKTPDNDYYRSKFVKELPTPNRDLCYRVLKKLDDNETPETKRRRKVMGTPPTVIQLPEECTTPYLEKKKSEYCDSRIHKLPTPPAPTTPLTVFKKRFWKEALGDLYESPTQFATQISHSDSDVQIPATAPTQSTGDNIHVQRLNELIKNRKVDKLSTDTDDIPESAPQTEYIDDINTECRVDWRDPSEFFESGRFKNKMDAMQYVGKPNFIISCSDEQLKLKLLDQIAELKGEVCINTTGYDQNCSHFLCEKPNRGEKMFSAIAGGKWVLGLQYIEDSIEAGYFLNEELYQWGNPKSTKLPELDNTSRLTGCAAYRWQQKLQAAFNESGKHVGIFSDFRVILHCNKKEMFKTLIEAGSGIVLDVKEPFSASHEALTATHCIIDAKKFKLLIDDRQAFQRANVLCVNILYLQAYITSDLVPDCKQFIC